MKNEFLLSALLIAAPVTMHAQSNETAAAAQPARKKIIGVKVTDRISVRIDCNKLTNDNRLTFDFLKQFDTHGHVGWTVEPARQSDPMILRIKLKHLLEQDSWTVEKLSKVMTACNVAEGWEKYLPPAVPGNAAPGTNAPAGP